MCKQLPHSPGYPLDVPMPMQQALAPEDLSAMQLLTVPDLWPPIDSPPAAAPQCQRPTGAAFAEQVGNRPGQQAGSPSAEQADGGDAWTRQFAVLLAEALTGARPVRQITAVAVPAGHGSPVPAAAALQRRPGSPGTADFDNPAESGRD